MNSYDGRQISLVLGRFIGAKKESAYSFFFIGIGRGEGGFVCGPSPHPAVGHPLPGRDRVAPADEISGGGRRLEERVRVAAAPRVGLDGQHVLRRRVVERVVEARNAADAVPERRMRGDVLDLLAVDPNLTAVAQAVEVLLPIHRACRGPGLLLVLTCSFCHCGPPSGSTMSRGSRASPRRLGPRGRGARRRGTGRNAPNGIRTRATTLKGWRPRPLVDGGGRPRIAGSKPAARLSSHRDAHNRPSAILERGG